MKEYKAISSIVKSGEVLKSKKDEYVVEELISDGINRIYLAKNSKNENVVIKQFYFNKPDFLKLQYFLYEKLSHPLIDKPMDMFEIESYHFQVKPFYKDFVSLENFASPKIDLETKKKLILVISHFINYLHSNNIAHTDLKPEQFIIVDGKIKLLDFDFGVTDDIYFPGGTKEWFTPEHIKKEKITTKSDIFTLGMFFHFLLTSKHPFYRYFDENFEDAILNGKYELQIYPDLFSKMLEVDPNKRIEISELIKYFEVPNRIYLKANNKKYLIVTDELITKKICKLNFKIKSKNIPSKVFYILEKENGWFVKGIENNSLKVYVDDKDATNKEIQIHNSSIIKVGDMVFEVIF